MAKEVPLSKARVLLVDDSTTVRTITGKALTERGYDVSLASTGSEALDILAKDLPDLMVLDVELPDIDGFEICRLVKADPRTHRVPILILTVLDQPGFEVIAIDSGADDFVTKPVDPLVLDARIGMIVRRSRRERLANPLTGLPGSVPIDQEIGIRLVSGKTFGLCSVDLDNFKEYNDKYGYQKGDELVLLTATIIQAALSDDRESFIGHLGADDFVFLAGPAKCASVADAIIKNFDEAVPLYYDKKTRQRGYFEVAARKGPARKVPFLTISIAMVSNENERFSSSIEMMDALVELKKYAKKFGESVFVTERRSPGNARASGSGRSEPTGS